MSMEKTNALKLRQNLGLIIKKLLKTGEPILVEKDRTPVAVLITLDDFKKRFVDVEADNQRKEIIKKIRAAKLSLPKGATATDLIRDLRS
jgi:PHD/YefM family antitoxin component YafN of YafNO toxin-antitoxin module